MILVIFGAGASHGCVRGELTLPLTCDLFAPEYMKYGAGLQWSSSVIYELQNPITTESLEKLLDRYQRRGTPERASQFHTIKHYLQRLFWHESRRVYEEAHGATAYAALVSALRSYTRDLGCLIATFNYDTLLERAMFPYLTMEIDTFATGSLRILKVHGSENWTRRIRNAPATSEATGNTAEWQITNIGSMDISDEFRARPLSISPEEDPECWRAAPAIGVPTLGKASALGLDLESAGFECPKSHRDAFFKHLRSVRRVLIIGWRGLDEHFTRRLINGLDTRPVPSELTVAIVTNQPEATRETQENLQRTGLAAERWVYSHQGFAGFLDRGQFDGFLFEKWDRFDPM